MDILQDPALMAAISVAGAYLFEVLVWHLVTKDLRERWPETYRPPALYRLARWTIRKLKGQP